MKVEEWLEKGKTVRDIALLWNQGNTGKCSSGINSLGVSYDSCDYAKNVQTFYNN